MESPQPAIRVKHFNLSAVFNFLKDHRFDYLNLFLIGAVIIGIDQWTKAVVRAKIPLGTDWLPDGLMWLLPYARIRHWYNSGAAFGIFQNGNLVFTILGIIVILFILYYFPRTDRKDWWLRVAMAMQFAGAAGNLIDRLILSPTSSLWEALRFSMWPMPAFLLAWQCCCLESGSKNELKRNWLRLLPCLRIM
jgi:lipoprotein signal peptidase